MSDPNQKITVAELLEARRMCQDQHTQTAAA